MVKIDEFVFKIFFVFFYGMYGLLLFIVVVYGEG